MYSKINEFGVKKIILALIITFFTFTSVNAAKECIWPEREMFDKRDLMYRFSHKVSINYQLNSNLIKKLDKIFLKYNKDKKIILLKKLDIKLQYILKEYDKKLNKKYNNNYVNKYSREELSKIKLLFWLYNYFNKEFYKNDIRFKNFKKYKKIFSLKNGEKIELNSIYYPNSPRHSCVIASIWSHRIFENSDIKNNTKYYIIEKNNKTYLISYYKFSINKIKVEIYNVWKGLISFKQPLYSATWTLNNLDEIIKIWIELNYINYKKEIINIIWGQWNFISFNLNVKGWYLDNEKKEKEIIEKYVIYVNWKYEWKLQHAMWEGLTFKNYEKYRKWVYKYFIINLKTGEKSNTIIYDSSKYEY